MIRITQVLCPIDFSDFSRRALDQAAAYACRYGATLVILYVFRNLPVMGGSPLVLNEIDRHRLTRKMRRFAAHLPPQIVVDIRIEEAADIHRGILAQAAAIRADLLVIGSHGRSGFERLFLGSVTEKLLRKAPCPILVVPRRADDLPPDALPGQNRILCAVDFSDGSRAALSAALSLAEHAGGTLSVLHVVVPEHQDHPLLAALDLLHVRAAAESDRLVRVRDLIPAHAQGYCTAAVVTSETAAFVEILRHAAAIDSELIVMGIQGRGAIDRMVFGSNTARVTRASSCPVLIVPSHEPAQVATANVESADSAR